MSHKMDPEIKAEWVAALRSGQYKQGKDYLRTEGDAYCCLGVLCDIAGTHGVGSWGDQGYFNSKDLSEGDNVVLPEFVMAWAGLDSSNPEIGKFYSCASRNDTGSSFAEIADMIDEYL